MVAGSYVLIVGLTYGLHGRCFMDQKKEILKMSKDIDGLTAVMHKQINGEDDIYIKTIKSLVLERSLNMDWTDACEIVERAVELFAANTKQAGAFSREAVDKAVTINAAWRRIQRG